MQEDESGVAFGTDGEKRNAHRILVGKSNRNKKREVIGRSRFRRKNNIKMFLKGVEI
jgi:hypothetical protein